MNIKKRKEKLASLTKEALRDTSQEAKNRAIQSSLDHIQDPEEYAHAVFDALVDSIVSDESE